MSWWNDITDTIGHVFQAVSDNAVPLAIGGLSLATGGVGGLLAGGLESAGEAAAVGGLGEAAAAGATDYLGAGFSDAAFDAASGMAGEAGGLSAGTAAGGLGVDAALGANPAVASRPFYDAVSGAVSKGAGSLLGAGVTSGINALTGGGQKGVTAAQNAADPFGPQRGQYQQQLQAMMQPGSTFQAQDPSYNFRMQQGEQAVNAGAASSGMLNSGNRLSALQAYGQNMASTEYQNQFSRLSQLSGAGAGSTGTAGQIASNANSQSNAGSSAIGNAFGNAASGYFNSPGNAVSNFFSL